MELLQDLSVDFSQLVKKHIKGLKKLSSKEQKAFGKLFADFKEGLDDMSTNESVNEGKFKVDDLVYNKRTKTIGIVRMGDDRYGEVKTDADGNVSVKELEKYNPIKNRHHQKVKVAPSTEKEINKRGLFNPFKNESVNEAQEPEIITQLRKGGYQTLKDPQTGKKHKVDNYSSSAIVAVYDALKKDKVKEKFVNLPLPKMVNVAFKAMK